MEKIKMEKIKIKITEEQVKQAIEMLNNKATRKDIITKLKLNMSENTLSRRISEAGYIYSNSAKAYYLEGEEPPKLVSKTSNSKPKKKN